MMNESLETIQRWAEELEEVFALRQYNSKLKLTKETSFEDLAEAYSSLYREMDLIIIVGCVWSSEVDIVNEYMDLLTEAFEEDDPERMQVVAEDMDILRDFVNYQQLQEYYKMYIKRIKELKGGK